MMRTVPVDDFDYSHLAGTRLIDIVTFYEVRYLFGMHFDLDTNYVKRLENQHALDCNDAWYKLGLYEKYGRDFFGRSYRQVEETDDGYAEWKQQQTEEAISKTQERLGH